MAVNIFPQLTGEFPVTPDVTGLRLFIPNLYFIGQPGPGNPWSLVDGGMPGRAGAIERLAEKLFGPNNPPQSILVTHGHFDHVGSLKVLAEKWKSPVFAHPLELPYLTGKAIYPAPDPTVGGGLVSALAPTYSREGADLTGHVQPLPEDGSVPGLPDWKWLHTPGHTPGHISFFRESDRVLIAGDAFVTLQGESLLAYFRSKPEISGPPAYYTINWEQAKASVKLLTALDPTVATTGHGLPMSGLKLRSELADLAKYFSVVSVPSGHFYADHPFEVDETGLAKTEGAPDMSGKFWGNVALGGAVGLVALGGLWALRRRE